MANSGELASNCQQAIDVLYEGEETNALAMLQSASQSLTQLAELDSKLATLPSMLDEAIIQVEEASSELRSYVDGIEMNPERMAWVEDRFSKVMSISRKHHVMAEDLYQHHQELLQQIEALDCSDEKLQAMEQEVSTLKQTFLTSAEKLSKISYKRYDQRQLDKLISKSMHELKYGKAKFHT